MEKVYRLLQWLDITQAVDWLQDLTDTNLTGEHLLKLCSSGQCDVYANAEGVNGYAGVELAQKVIGRGIQVVCNPLRLIRSGTQIPRSLVFEGTVFPADSGEDEDLLVCWVARQTCECEPLFKPADIEALAAKMNGVPEQPSTAEVEDLRQQLEQEHAARQAAEQRANRAEAEAAGLRKRLGNGKAVYEGGRQESEAMKNDFASTQAALIRQENELAAAIAEIERLRQQAVTAEHAKPNPEASATCLTFPYATKELEAMRAAVAKYWEGYTTDKRQPTQKEVAIELGELLGLPLMKNRDPARKAVNLAAAIKPVDLPDA